MKEELKQKMIGVIGTHSNALIESIAEKCAQVAIDHYNEIDQALSMSGVVGRSEQLTKWEHKHMTGLQKEIEATGYTSWINADLYPDGKIYTQEYTQWLERQVIALRQPPVMVRI